GRGVDGAEAGVNEERNPRGPDAIKNGGHRWEPAEMYIEEAQHRDDDKVRQDEGPPPGPGSPKAAAQIGDEDPHLNSQGPGHGLTHRNGLTHFLPRQPLALPHQFSFQLPTQRHRPTKAERAQPEVIPDEVPDRDARGNALGGSLRLRRLWFLLRHGCSSPRSAP